ncbi:acyl transferase 15-like [Triticum aestivum]|uniref:10-deacetylbaccatin III 10-O-acetyltransferase n=3 Tax=Triticum TaxID=4564 RepID=A0A9R1QCC2_TRITD|nr:acyl transferase 15-like [Triticum aestivum]CDM83817.1 unnamed protein product [Triticum aestivum]VAH74753.1 unnamed protein product [Triticum turgidum subsp. durum]
MSSVVINKYPLVVVQPSEPVTATGSEIALSTYDKVVPMVETVFCVYEHPIQEPAEIIRRGLSQALVHYYPIAGRLATGATSGDVVIKCTGEGVSFVAASANCAIKDVADLCDSSLQEELALYYPAVGFSHSEPLMLMQVTVFSCGGCIVGLTWNHQLCDGIGLAQFFRAVGELARGLPSPSVVPVRSADSLMFDLPASVANCARIAATLQPFPRASQNITRPSSLIDGIRRRYSMSSNDGPCTVFEAVAAVLWRCRTRAIRSDPDSLVMLSFTADARKYASAKKGYYGNCVTIHLVAATSGMVTNGVVVDLVKMIHRAKVPMPDQSIMDELQRQHGYNLPQGRQHLQQSPQTTRARGKRSF